MPSAVAAIAAKEFTENMHARRFQIALVLATLLMTTSVVALAVSYKEDLAAFQVEQSSREQGTRLGGPALEQAEVARALQQPNPLAIFAGGPGEAARRSDTQGSGGGAASGAGSGGSASPTNLRFEPLDLGFVAVVVMTFMAVLFAHDAISGERERGTLKLLLSNPVPKDALLLGKYLGGMASLLVPFAVSLVVGLAAFAALGVPLTGEEWLRLALVVGLFVPLASAFYLLGLLVSSVARRSGTALLSLLLVWLVLVFGAGNIAGAVAKTVSEGGDDAALFRELQAIQDDQQARTQEISEQLFAVYGQPNATEDPALKARADALQAQQQALFDEGQQRRAEAIAAAHRQLAGQLRTAEAIASLSPAESYRNLATALARSDYWSFARARDAADAYLHETQRARSAWETEHGGPGGRFVIISFGPGAAPARPVGEGFEAPEFHYRAASVGEQLGSSGGAVSLVVVLGANVAAFVAATFALRRYDVR